MSTYYNIKIQYNGKNGWEDISINGHSTLSGCGGWLYQYTRWNDLFNRGCGDFDIPEHGTYMTLAEWNSYAKKLKKEYENEFREYIYSKQLDRIENKLNKVLQLNEITRSEDYYFEELVECINDVNRIITIGDQVEGIATLYSGVPLYVEPEDVRILFWYD